ncbi:MAG TPA: nucleotidyltransferase domain-containing protein [Candidatus Polarisedimenticolaceae bacterium]|nr:nucleotidyltransferase domain-containing protein [Candidatus Polarisedimenticolaceae bacterium]
MDEGIEKLVDEIRLKQYPDADVVFAAGSIVRGEGTAFSDLDLVVVYPQVPQAYRESFRRGGYPVEAFVHDPATLEYFFLEVDRPSGIPSLPQMVVEGFEVPGPSSTSRMLKEMARSVIAAGPPALDVDTERRMRYSVSDLLDDLRAPRTHDELIGAGTRLYELLADYHLRRTGHWSGRGKSVARALQSADPALSVRYGDAFDRLFEHHDSGPVVRLAEDLLRDAGGPLFEGYRSDAPAAWRRDAVK